MACRSMRRYGVYAAAPLMWAGPEVLDTGNTLQAVSCPSATLCVAVDNDGNAITSTNPTGGAGAWTVKSTEWRPPARCVVSVGVPVRGG